MIGSAPFGRRAAETPISPPHNIQLEQALLGAILTNNRTFVCVECFLKPEHFFEPIHQRMYEIAASLVSEGKACHPDEAVLGRRIAPHLSLPRLAAGRLVCCTTDKLERAVANERPKKQHKDIPD